MVYRVYLFLTFTVIALATFTNARAQVVAHWETAEPLPVQLANNAVASLTLNDTCFVFSFMGIDESKIFSGISSRAFKLNTITGVWTEIAPVPGRARIAASAQGLHDKIYIFSGYIVEASGAEITSPNVDIYDPTTDTYTRGADMPTPADDQITAVWRDSLIYNISGWSQSRNVRTVQAYDPILDTWFPASNITGPGVFGGAGGIVGDVIVYAGGAQSGLQFGRIHPTPYIGQINPSDPTEISWSELPLHPGAPKYRMAAASFGSRVIFAGGTDNAYNFDGIGYNGDPSSPSAEIFGYNTVSGVWESYEPAPIATMDHRGLALCGNALYIVGGMIADQEVYAGVSAFVIDSVVTDVAERPASEQPVFEIAPNPFSISATLTYTPPTGQSLTLEIIDLFGRIVSSATLEGLQAGPQRYTIMPYSLSAGAYVVRLRTDSSTSAQLIRKID